MSVKQIGQFKKTKLDSNIRLLMDLMTAFLLKSNYYVNKFPRMAISDNLLNKYL